MLGGFSVRWENSQWCSHDFTQAEACGYQDYYLFADVSLLYFPETGKENYNRRAYSLLLLFGFIMDRNIPHLDVSSVEGK
jgi:hypothetical protein